MKEERLIKRMADLIVEDMALGEISNEVIGLSEDVLRELADDAVRTYYTEPYYSHYLRKLEGRASDSLEKISLDEFNRDYCVLRDRKVVEKIFPGKENVIVEVSDLPINVMYGENYDVIKTFNDMSEFEKWMAENVEMREEN